jgi:SAM-dependent methyltransferase
VQQLIARIPDITGRVLDVACGKGATTRYLTRFYPAEDVTGINLSAKQLDTARDNAPGCTFLEMDATDLDFEAGSFEAIVSVEAACHFDTREQFLREALRVLAPGGRLALSDILLSERAERLSPVFVAENHLGSPAEYEALLRRAGFADAVVRDVTDRTWEPYLRHLTAYLRSKRRLGDIDGATYRWLLAGLYRRRVPSVRGYVLVAARKP